MSRPTIARQLWPDFAEVGAWSIDFRIRIGLALASTSSQHRFRRNRSTVGGSQIVYVSMHDDVPSISLLVAERPTMVGVGFNPRLMNAKHIRRGATNERLMRRLPIRGSHVIQSSLRDESRRH